MLPVLLVSVFVLAYVVVGYPLLLRLLVAIRGPRRVRQADITPPVSFVISAYNEADVIRAKLQNALALDYPPDRREIVVISDCSSDGTDDIVREFAGQGVRLIRQDERRGKTAGLNRAIPLLTGEIVVFSDANAMYDADAVRRLVRNFADADVGYVTGEARYLVGGAAADAGERAYWGYEMELKRLETQIGSMVGGDGAIYAIRRELWRTLPEDAINDFLNPLQIVEAGWRGIYEPEAVCYEETSGRFKSEYRRRVRIVSRSWRAVFQAPGVLNPFRVGLFSWCLVSHKVLRWNTGLFATVAAVAAVKLIVDAIMHWPLPVLAALTATAAAAALTPAGRRIVSMGAYFWVINAASLVGVIKGSLGRVTGVWATPREQAVRPIGPLVPVGPAFLIGGTVLAGAAMIAGHALDVRAAQVAFWGSLAALSYVYVGYPLLLSLLRAVGRRPIKITDVEPSVCLFIAANDEAAVIGAKIENALEIDYPAEKLQIVVVSDGSVDGTDEVVRGYAPRVQLISRSPRQGKIAAINYGLGSVTCDIVVFSDANTFLSRDAVRALVRNFGSEDVGCVSGDVTLVGDRALLAKSEDLYYRYERWIQHAESDIGSMIGADGALYAIRRELFVPRAEDTILDDMAIPMSIVRGGRRVVFEPEARAQEPGVETAREEFSRKTRVVAGAMQFLARNDSAVPLSAPQVILSLVSHKALRWMSPGFAMMLFVTSLMLTGTGAFHQYRTVWIVSLTIMGLGLLGTFPKLRRNPLVGLSHYLCLVQLAAAVGFVRGLAGRQSVLWRRFDRAHASHSET